MAAADLQITENSFLVKFFDMVNAKLHLVWGHFQHGNLAMPFIIYFSFYNITDMSINIIQECLLCLQNKDFLWYLSTNLLYLLKKPVNSTEISVKFTEIVNFFCTCMSRNLRNILNCYNLQALQTCFGIACMLFLKFEFIVWSLRAVELKSTEVVNLAGR